MDFWGLFEAELLNLAFLNGSQVVNTPAEITLQIIVDPFSNNSQRSLRFPKCSEPLICSVLDLPIHCLVIPHSLQDGKIHIIA